MMETKLTVRVPHRILENAKRYARENNTTLTYLQQIPDAASGLEDAPIVRRLTGSILWGAELYRSN
jgi:hypothetical protein